MNSIKYYFIIMLLVLFLLPFNVKAAVPTSGSFKCDYTLDYTDNSNSLSYKMYIEASYSNNAFNVKMLKNIRTDTGKEDPVFPSVMISQGADMQNPVLDGNNNLNTDLTKENFTTSNGTKWKCPTISYAISSNGYDFGIINIGPSSKAKDYTNSKTASPTNGDKDITQPTTEAPKADKTTKNCTYSTNTTPQLTVTLQIKNGVGTFSIAGVTRNSIKITDCPGKSDLTYCQYRFSNDTTLHTNDYIVYNQSCYEAAEKAGNDPDSFNSFNMSDDASTTTDADGNTTGVTGADGTSNDDSSKQDDTEDTAGSDVADCGILGEDFLDYLKDAFNLIQVIGPILALVFSMVDMLKAVASGEEDAKKKAFSNTGKRLTAAVLLYMIPAILTLLFSIINKFTGSTCGIG